jgi:hypothetical protein
MNPFSILSDPKQLQEFGNLLGLLKLLPEISRKLDEQKIMIENFGVRLTILEGQIDLKEKSEVY